ncbi:MAG TPA: hypothetical protein VK892_02640 [Pyrinomonadaceae bacterium]|nr:hypothetical protein [Pyrinomonadaceae bacterium]
MKVFTGQQTIKLIHLKREMLNRYHIIFTTLLLFFAIFISGCSGIIKKKENTAILPKLETADQTELKAQVNRLASIDSMRAKMDLRFEDNSFAAFGFAEKYRAAPGEIVVQRPNNILLKIQAPIIYSDLVQMTSDGEKFRVAILQDDAGGKLRNFVIGTNSADYSLLRKQVNDFELGNGDTKEIKKSVNAFADIRPQHFTEAILMRPINDENFYVQSEIFQDEFDPKARKKSPMSRILRGYYLLDELRKNEDGSLSISRRFWFDRVGLISLARQQIFDTEGNLESDIVYGAEAQFTENRNYSLPLRIEVTRPKEKYKMSLTYQAPETVSIGRTYKPEVFVLENTKNLPEIDLDKKLQEASVQQPPASGNSKSAAKNQ